MKKIIWGSSINSRHPGVTRAWGCRGLTGGSTHRFVPIVPTNYFIELGFELNYFIELSSRAPLFGGKMPPKIKLSLWGRSAGHIKKNWTFMIFSSTLIWKNNSIWVERRRITVGESQKRKANNNNDDEKKLNHCCYL